MSSADLRPDEAGALQALQSLQVLDSAPDAEFDALVKAASLLCGVPIALISLIDAERQWFKANVGLPGTTETPRDVAFCAHAVLGEQTLVVPDATQDARFADNPLVTGAPGIRFYAGAPLRLSSGHNVGTLCLIDRQPRQLDAVQLQALQYLAVAAASALEGRRARLAAEQAARDTARAALVEQHSADAIIGLLADLTVVRWNPAAERLFGYGAADIIGRSAALLAGPQERTAQAVARDEATAGRVQTYETLRRHRDGHDIPVAITLVPEADASGRYSGATLFVRDHRAHRQALTDAAERERLLQRLYETTPAMLQSVDLDGRVTLASEAWLSCLGLGRSDLVGRPWTDFLTPTARATALEHLVPAALGDGSRHEVALQFVTRVGASVDVHLSALLERGEAGTPARIVMGLQDVTQRLSAERALHAERQRLSNIIEGTHAGVWEWHVPSGALHLNERSAAILGQTLAELGPVTIDLRTERTHPDDLAAVQAAMQRHLGGESEVYEVESRVRHRDGHWVWILDRGRLMTRTADGRPEWVFGIHQDISARKAQDEALRKSEDFLERTGRLAGIGGWELDVASGAITWSAETRRIHGVAPDYTPQLTSAIEFYAPEARPAIQAAVGRGLEQGLPWDLELPLITAEGRQIWVRAVGAVEFEQGQAIRLAGAFQDITERKALQDRLLEQRRFLRQVVDSVPGLIAHIGPDRRYTLINRAYVEWDRGAHEHIVGARVQDIHDTAGYQALAPRLEQAFAGETVSFEVELVRAGVRHAMQVTYVPDTDDAGEVVGVFSLKVDVTALRRAEERLHQVMEASPQGVFTADLAGRCTYANAAWQRISGRSLEPGKDLDLRQVIHPEDLADLLAVRQRVLAEGGIVSSEHRYVRPAGDIVWVRGHLTLLRGHESPDCFVGSVEDVTERRRLDQVLADRSAALARSNEDLERFAYVASHDLQEPLRMVTSYGQLLTRRHRDELSAEAQEFLHYMVDGGQRAQALIRDLLSLARLDSQARPRQEVALEEVLSDVLQPLRLKVAETAATITHDPLPAVIADAAQMRQLMTNLLGNALKFVGPRAPCIHIGAAREGAYWRVSVRDNGIGIEAKYFERVFVMFQRLHLRAEHEGTGIGLALCKKIVERHGGRIGVASTPGEGSTFWFTLPAGDAAADGHEPSNPRP